MLGRVLVLSISCSWFFSAVLLSVDAPSAAELANRQKVLEYINSAMPTILAGSATKNPLNNDQMSVWRQVWQPLADKVKTGNLAVADVVTIPKVTYDTATYSGDYNNTANIDPKIVAYADIIAAVNMDGKNSVLLSLLYHGANTTLNAQGNYTDGTRSGPAGLGKLQDPILYFYTPDSADAIKYNFVKNSDNNYYASGGLLLKTKEFCAALDSTYYKGIWSGAACTDNGNCCADQDGVQQVCNNGLCHTPPAVCGTALHAKCPGIAPDKSGCCTGAGLQCVGLGDSAQCLATTGGACDDDLSTSCVNYKADKTGDLCIAGVCVPPATCLALHNSAQQCNDTTRPCCKGLICNNGACLGGIGYACNLDQDCNTQLICDASSGSAICTQDLTLCATDPAKTIANGQACQLPSTTAPNAPCCTNAAFGFSCGLAQDQKTSVCCIDIANDTDLTKQAAQANCANDQECCAGTVCKTVDGTMPSATALGSCIASDPETLSKDLIAAQDSAAAGTDHTGMIIGSVAGALVGVSLFIYKFRDKIRAFVKTISGSFKDVTPRVTGAFAAASSGNLGAAAAARATLGMDANAAAAAQGQITGTAAVAGDEIEVYRPYGGSFNADGFADPEDADAIRAAVAGDAHAAAQRPVAPLDNTALQTVIREKTATLRAIINGNRFDDMVKAGNSAIITKSLAEIIALEVASGKDYDAAVRETFTESGIDEPTGADGEISPARVTEILLALGDKTSKMAGYSSLPTLFQESTITQKLGANALAAVQRLATRLNISVKNAYDKMSMWVSSEASAHEALPRPTSSSAVNFNPEHDFMYAR